MRGRPGVVSRFCARCSSFAAGRGLALLLLVASAACGRDAEPPPPWHEEDGYRWRELRVEDGHEPGFTALEPSRTGIDFVNRLSEQRMIENQVLLNGSGVAVGDVDGDGRADLYFARLEGPNALFRNLGGWNFQAVEGAGGAGLADRFSSGVVLADVDGDGDLDLFVTTLDGPNALFLNDGTGSFRELEGEASVGPPRGSETAAFADVDGDGDLDLYVTNYKRRSLLDSHPPDELSFERIVERTGEGYRIVPRFREHFELEWRGDQARRLEIAEPDELYLNDGAGRFEEVSWTGGRFLDADGEPVAEAPRDWGLAARFHDVDGDGDPDLYVCNDLHSPDRFWRNMGDGVFRAVGPLALRKTAASCMAVDFADVDRDGHVDLFGVDMLSRESRLRKTQSPAYLPPLSLPGEIATTVQVPRNVLLLGRGDGTYTESGYLSGVAASEWSWSALFLDVDLDGYEDLLVANGHRFDLLDTDTRLRIVGAELDDHRRGILLHDELARPNIAFRNRGDLTFEDASSAWGFARGPDVSHGLAAGDLDGDGDLDAVLNRLGDPALVLRNDAAAPRVAVRLRGRPPNTAGVGAQVTLRGGPVETQTKEVTAGGPYLSSSEPQLVFAAPAFGRSDLEILWPDGTRSEIRGARPNRLYEPRQPPGRGDRKDPEPSGLPGRADRGDRPSPSGGRSVPTDSAAPYFEDVSARLGHVHHETPFDDSRRQPLVPFRLSQLGPGVAWQDLDGDGDADLAIGAGAGGRLGLFRNDGGRFQPIGGEHPPAELDLAGIVGWPGSGEETEARRGALEPAGAGRASLLFARFNYEAGSPAAAAEAAAILRASPSAGEGVALDYVAPGARSGVGPLAAADVDGDGDLDLFAGGRALPAAYPVPASSFLFLNRGGRLVEDPTASTLFRSLGLVSAALFSDVDGDGDPDLLAALEWGPVRLFVNDGGRFHEATREWGLAERTGRWNGLTAGDLDGDGRLDLVSTSWGLNTVYALETKGPLSVYYGDFDQNGTLDVVEARHDPRLDGAAPLLGFEWLSKGLPYLRSRVPSFTAYADADLGELLGPGVEAARRLEARTLEHTVWLNRGNRFEPVPLPVEAQLAPAFYAGVADFDGDGNEDVFLAQNFFATHPAVPRMDAGRGLWLRGDGRGRLEPIPGQVSGVAVYGDQRGAALGDFDADARVDLVVTQNGTTTRLFRNVGARPGLRVRLVGRPGNPWAVGAAIRVVYSDGSLGPLREIHAGSGYWSQDDPVQVLGLREEAAAVRTRWPGGVETETPVPDGARDLTVRAPDGRP